MKKFFKKKIILFFLIFLIIFCLTIVSNFFIGTGNYSGFKSLLSNDSKYFIKKYLFPYKYIDQLEQRIDFLDDTISIIEDENLSSLELNFKQSLKDIVLIKKKDLKLTDNYILSKYKLKKGFYSGIYRQYPGSGYIDFHSNKFLILSARGVLGFHENIKDINNNLIIKQIKNNINEFITLENFNKRGWFSLKGLLVDENQIFISYTEEINKECWNTGIISGKINFISIEFKKFFSAKKCITEKLSEPGEDFSAHQSGGKIIKFDENHILLSVGDYRRRSHAQDKNSINGKIIKININNSDHEIISMGHRNPQGIYYDKKKNYILVTEQGPQGGDEINLIEVNDINNKRIKNFGWAIVSAGEHYGGKIKRNEDRYKKYPLYKSHSQYNFIEPLKSFVPSIAITAITKISDDKYVAASLKDKSIYFFKLNNRKEIINLKRVEVFERVRDLFFKENKLYLFLENTASIGIISLI